MSSSRSDDVNKSVRSSVFSNFFHLVSLVFYLLLNGFMVFQESLRMFEVSIKFQGCFKQVLRVFKECFKEASRVFQEGFRDISRVFQESFKGVSTKIEGCFK